MPENTIIDGTALSIQNVLTLERLNEACSLARRIVPHDEKFRQTELASRDYKPTGPGKF
jgi:hypothetical protein